MLERGLDCGLARRGEVGSPSDPALDESHHSESLGLHNWPDRSAEQPRTSAHIADTESTRTFAGVKLTMIENDHLAPGSYDDRSEAEDAKAQSAREGGFIGSFAIETCCLGLQLKEISGQREIRATLRQPH